MGSLRFPDRTLPRSHECSTSPGSIGFVHRCAAPVVSIVAGLLTILALAALPTTAAGAPPAPASAAPVAAASAASPASDEERDIDAVETEGPDVLNERARWFKSRRLGPDGEIPQDARNRALAQIEENIGKGILRGDPSRNIAGDGWSPIGPAPLLDGTYTFSGRITAIAIHPTNANIAYVGGAQGGVWKTADHGATWTPLTDTQKSLAIGAIAIDPTNPNVIYAGTGEANNSCDSYFGAGILKSTDGGATWTLIAATPFANSSISRIIVNPTNSSILLAANTSGAGGFVCYGVGATVGVWRSTNSGVTWTRVLGTTQTAVTSHTHDLVIDPSNSSILYAGVYQSGIWKSTNGGVSWTHLTTGLPAGSRRSERVQHPIPRQQSLHHRRLAERRARSPAFSGVSADGYQERGRLLQTARCGHHRRQDHLRLHHRI